MDSDEMIFLRRLAQRDTRMWATVISEFADTKALVNTLMALVRFQIENSGVPSDEVDQFLAEQLAQHRARAQAYARSLLPDGEIPKGGVKLAATSFRVRGIDGVSLS